MYICVARFRRICSVSGQKLEEKADCFEGSISMSVPSKLAYSWRYLIFHSKGVYICVGPVLWKGNRYVTPYATKIPISDGLIEMIIGPKLRHCPSDLIQVHLQVCVL